MFVIAPEVHSALVLSISFETCLGLRLVSEVVRWQLDKCCWRVPTATDALGEASAACCSR